MAKRNRIHRRRRSLRQFAMWKDPVVRWLGLAIAVLVIGGLMTLISMILTGVVPLRLAPQTAQEAEIVEYKDLIDSNKDQDAWTDLIILYAHSGRIAQARRQLEGLKASEPDVTRTQSISYAEANILMAEKHYDKALVLLEEVRVNLMEAYEQELASDSEKNWAKSNGIPSNYFSATMNMVDIYLLQNDFPNALTKMDDYLEHRGSDATMLISRAELKLEMGDVAGAEADFKAAQRFLPEDETIIEGLERVKAMQ